MFKHINGDDAVEMPARDWKVIFLECIHRFTQKPGNQIVVFAGDVSPSPFTAMLTKIPVERTVIIAAGDQKALFVCRFAKQLQQRPELLLLLDRTPKHFDLPRKMIRLHRLRRHALHLLERIGLNDRVYLLLLTFGTPLKFTAYE